MLIRVEHNKDNPFYIMNRQTISDKNISWGARGLLAYLLSLPDDWQINVEQLTEASDKDGRDKVKSLLCELENAGYLMRQQSRNDGKFANIDYTIFEQPQVFETPQVDLPLTAKPQQLNTIYTNNIEKENIKEKVEQYFTPNCIEPNVEIQQEQLQKDTPEQLEEYKLELFNKLWEIYPRKVAKQNAIKTWNKKMTKEKTLTKALTRAKQIGLTLNIFKNGEWQNRKIEYIPHLQTWLNANIPD